MSHQNVDFTRVTVATSGGDSYEIDLQPTGTTVERSSGVLASATLRWKGEANHHAMRSLRERFTFEVTATAEDSMAALDRVLEQIDTWANASGQKLSVPSSVV
jgi:hypothetical protein